MGIVSRRVALVSKWWRGQAPCGVGTWIRLLLCDTWMEGRSVSGRTATLPTGPVMMVAPVAIRVPVIAPMVVSPMVAVVPPPHHDDGRWDTETDVDIDAGVGRLGLRE
jgi:hypothetical protein